jgi:hypothetical protein
MESDGCGKFTDGGGGSSTGIIVFETCAMFTFRALLFVNLMPEAKENYCTFVLCDLF